MKFDFERQRHMREAREQRLVLSAPDEEEPHDETALRLRVLEICRGDAIAARHALGFLFSSSDQPMTITSKTGRAVTIKHSGDELLACIAGEGEWVSLSDAVANRVAAGHVVESKRAEAARIRAERETAKAERIAVSEGMPE